MRIRSIKPEFWRSQDVADLPREFRLLWIGLWSYVDDNGVGVDDYRQIAADLFALEEDPMEAREFVREGLARLSRALRIARYSVEGRSYIYVNGWDRHQRVDRPNKPRYPLPPADMPPPETEETPAQNGHVHHINGSTKSALATPSRDIRETPSSGTEEQGNRGTGEQGEKAAPRAHAPARTRGTTTLQQLADSAATPPADRIVRAWKAVNDPSNDYRPQNIREIKKIVDGMVRDGCNHDRIRDALDEFHRRPDLHSPKILTRLYDDAVRNHATATRRPAAAPSKADVFRSMADELRAEEAAAEAGQHGRPQITAGRGPIGIVIEGESA